MNGGSGFCLLAPSLLLFKQSSSLCRFLSATTCFSVPSVLYFLSIFFFSPAALSRSSDFSPKHYLWSDINLTGNIIRELRFDWKRRVCVCCWLLAPSNIFQKVKTRLTFQLKSQRNNCLSFLFSPLLFCNFFPLLCCPLCKASCI